MVLSAAVSSGVITAVQAWPEFFDGIGDGQGDDWAFPGRDTDTEDFRLEDATPESVQADLDTLMAMNQRVSVREEEPPRVPDFTGLPHVEWT